MAVEVIDVTLAKNTDNRPKILNYSKHFSIFFKERPKVI